MQAIILAAGAGRRLGLAQPKATIVIGGQPLIVRLIEQLRTHGVEEIAIVVGFEANQIIELTKSYNVRTILNPFYNSSDNLVSFWIGQSLISDTFILTHGDLIVQEAMLNKLIASQDDIVLPIDRSSMNEESMKILQDGDQVVGISKQIPLQIASGESVPFMKFSRKVIPSLRKILEQLAEDGNSKCYLEDAVFALLKPGQFQTSIMDVTGTEWIEIDTPEDQVKAREMFS